MRTKLFFDDIDATSNQTSEQLEIRCGQDMRFLIQVTKAGTDGNPKIIVEESIDGVVWTPLNDTETCDPFFIIDSSPFAIRDSYFMGAFIRLRLEPNGNTTGTLTANMGYKTKV